jgi:fumarate hydratase, class II
MDSLAHPVLQDIPLGIAATGMRHETDTMGGIEVLADGYWAPKRSAA